MEHRITDICCWVNRFTEISFSLIRRDCNGIADKLAKSVYRQTKTLSTFFYPHLVFMVYCIPIGNTTLLIKLDVKKKDTTKR